MSGNSSSSSRRGKKNGSHSSEKPKQPQRGLGVAQLEKIRLHSQMEEMKIQAYAAMQTTMGVAPPSHFAYPSSQSPYGYQSHNPHMMMEFADMERPNLRFSESHYNQRWNPNQTFPDNWTYGQPNIPTRHFLDTMEDPEQSAGMNFWLSMNGSGSGSSDNQDVDLELKL